VTLLLRLLLEGRPLAVVPGPTPPTYAELVRENDRLRVSLQHIQSTAGDALGPRP
jgi:hypothetical protein